MRKKIFILVWSIVIVTIIGVSYAYFSSTLYVNGFGKFVGTFDVQFSSVNVVNKSELEDISISNDGLSISFYVKLALPGESDTIEYTIINNGTIDATLEELVVHSEDDKDVTFECSSIAGDLLSGESKSGTIVVTWNVNSMSLQKDVNFNAEIVAMQKI